MSPALALRYRPQDFDQVVGQEVAVQSLKNALTSKETHHAYLFTGPRGIGKTSLARILAKSLNCEKGPTPCNQCLSCREITEGRSLSVLEIDGASNTSVDDVRTLRENVNYLPPGGRYKIYIIDEVHMLSTAAFNALLKTLEEPPPHVVFIFATTDPQKLPTTVLSRVIRFDLRTIPLQKIVSRLKEICQKEKIVAHEEALFQIAREAGGGLRDALSLLDQLSTFSGEITLSSVEEVLGLSPRRFVRELTAAILASDPSEVLKVGEKAWQGGVDLKRLALDLLEQIRHLLVIQVSTDPLLFDLPESDLQELAEEAKRIPFHRLDQIFRLLQRGVAEILRSPLPKVYLDVLLLRLCHHQEWKGVEEILKELENPRSSSDKNFSLFSSLAPPSSPPPPPRKAETPLSSPPPKPPAGWQEFMTWFRTQKPQIASLLENGRLLSLGDEEVTLTFPPSSVYADMIKEEERKKILEGGLEEFFKKKLVLRCADQEMSSPPAGALLHEAIDIFKPLTTTVVGNDA